MDFKNKSLYHYCSFDTFEKIVSNGNLRLLDIEQSDDNQERILFLTEFIKICEYETERHKQNPPPLAAVYFLLTELLKDMFLKHGGTTFATCFGDTYTNRDLWSRYGVENNVPNTGICLELNPYLFNFIFNGIFHSIPLFHFGPVNYITTDRTSAILKTLENFNADILANYKNPELNNITPWASSIGDCASRLALKIYNECSLHKECKWSEQKEYRLLLNSIGEDKNIGTSSISLCNTLKILPAQSFITKRGNQASYRDLNFPKIKTQIFTGLYYTDEFPYTLDEIKTVLKTNGFDLSTFSIKKITLDK